MKKPTSTPPPPTMTKVTSSKLISSARASPMGSRPSQSPNPPDSPANQAVGDIAKNYGQSDAQETGDHPMSPGNSNLPDLDTSGVPELTPPPPPSSQPREIEEIDMDSPDTFFRGMDGVNGSMHAVQKPEYASASSSANVPLHKRPPMTISLRSTPESTPANAPAPTPTPVPRKSAADIIKAQLATANANRALTHPGTGSLITPSSVATPAPTLGFPVIHLSSSAQLVHFLSYGILRYWTEEISGPKCLLRVFDYDGTDAGTRVSNIADLLRNSIISIAPLAFKNRISPNVAAPSPELGKEDEGSPEGFLLHEVPQEFIQHLLAQRIWSTPTITFEARPFVNNDMPNYLFTLKGLSARSNVDVIQIVRVNWENTSTRREIESILACAYDIDENDFPSAVTAFIHSVSIEYLDWKEKGSIPAARYNILAVSPTTDPETWTNLRIYLRSLHYPSPLDGVGYCDQSFSPCGLCHSVAHPRGLCPFPYIPNWYGGGHTKESAKAKEPVATLRNKGKGKRTY
ncbi:hypothetical protein BJ138DRAFT_1237170 [Hygrophoropsis aurantiaca]|uniref:Uncharacterized protein n=1 Tax=Hygrophoropsis aurantiaca TaxID=72124 RepID=A0ACB7ZUX3_9AGAM|nr:hypothetical protein BJ138DRAFT_1237170 [Hygrophoropsis aurantiaca]